MQTVINGILTDYRLLGSKNKGSILVLHGWGQSSKDWGYVGEKLSEKYRVFLLDLPGFGASSVPETPFTTNDYANFVNIFANKIIQSDFILIGHSFGGKISIKIASNGSARIKKLFLISPSGIDTKSFLTYFKIFAAKVFKFLFFWMPKNFISRLRAKFGSRDYKYSKEMKGTFVKVINESVAEDAKRINTPTVIIWGEKDEEINLKIAKKLKLIIKQSILRIVWAAGHSVNLESPEKLLNILNDYI